MNKIYNTKEVVITKENIADFYKGMSDEDKIENEDIIYDVLYDRYEIIVEQFDLKPIHPHTGLVHHYERNTGNVSDSFFGVKDTLKPISEYVAEIKASEGYKQYQEEKFQHEGIVDNVLNTKSNEKTQVKEKLLKEISDHIEIEDIEMVVCGDSWVNGDDASINIYCDMDAEDQELLKVVSYPHVNGVTNYSDINGKFEIKKSELIEELEKNIGVRAIEDFNAKCEAEQDVEEKLTLG